MVDAIKKIVFDQKNGSIEMVDHPSFHDFRGYDSLFAVEACRWFINEVEIGGCAQTQGDGKTLHFSTTETGNRKISDFVYLQHFHDQ